MQRLPGGRERWCVGVAHPLKVVQAVQTYIGLGGKPAVRPHSRDYMEIQGLTREIEFQETLDLPADRLRFGIVRPPDRIEARPFPATRQRRKRTEVQRRRDRPLLEPRRNIDTTLVVNRTART